MCPLPPDKQAENKFPCGFADGLLIAHQTSGAEVPGSNSTSPTESHNHPDALQDHCVIMYRKTQGREGNLPLRQKKILKQFFTFKILRFSKSSMKQTIAIVSK